MHLAVDAYDVPIRIFVTDGAAADCKLDEGLTRRIDTLTDQSYDVNRLIEMPKSTGITMVISPRSNRKAQRFCNTDLYSLCHCLSAMA